MLKIMHSTVTREQGWAAFRRSHDVRWRERSHCIVRLRDGKSGPEIAQWLYRDEETIRRWVHAVTEAGLPGLEREPIPGRPSGLTADQLGQVKDAVRGGPRESG